MTTTGPHRDQPPDSHHPYTDPHNAAQSAVDTSVDSAGEAGWSLSRLDRAQVVIEVVTLVVCVPLAPTLMVMVAVQGWSRWWLIVTGVLAAWAGDAVWTLGQHTVAGIRARQHAAAVSPRAGSGGNRSGRHGVEPQDWGGDPRSGGHR